MNHNFADWNTTVLFDNTNIENRCNDANHTIYIVIDKNNNEYIVILNDDACYSIDEYVKDYNYVDSREAISWEDIRLYLLKHNIHFQINLDFDEEGTEIVGNNQWLYWYQIVNLLNDDLYESDSFYHTYEEAREVCIEECLSLIKET